MNQSHRPSPTPNSAHEGRRSSVRRLVAVSVLAAVGISWAGGGAADAGMTDEAIVECNGAYNTIDVTPRVLSDWANNDQWTATRVWIARWNGSSWAWSVNPWKVELASRPNSPIASDISRLQNQRFNKSDGYYYVYVQSFMWDGTKWYGDTGRYTTSYTQVHTSVSHEPDTRTTGTYCSL